MIQPFRYLFPPQTKGLDKPARQLGKAKAKLQLRLTQNEHFVAPRSDRMERSPAAGPGHGPEVSPEAVAAMAKRLVERTRKDLEAQMAVT